ncbi:MAG: DUF4836 family protein [Chitinophagaceae bacterium]
MKKSFFYPFFLAVMGLVTFSSCSKTSQKTLLIPKNASMVLELNGKKLFAEMGSPNLGNLQFFKGLAKKSRDSTLGQTLLHPQDIGLDLNSNIFFFYRKKVGFQNGYLGIIAHLPNPEKFNDFLLHHFPKIQWSQKGNIHMAAQNGKGILSWKNKILLALIPVPGRFGDTLALSTDSLNSLLKLEVDSLMKETSSQSVGDLVPFQKLEKQPGDARFWLNMTQIYKDIPGNINPMMATFIRPQYYDKSYLAGTLNFKPGKVILEGSSYSNDLMTEVGEKLWSQPINMEMVKRIPSDSILALMALAIHPSAIKDFLNLFGVDGLANMFLSKENLTLDEVLNSFNGDLVAALTQWSFSAQKSQTTGLSSGEMLPHAPTSKWLLAMGVGDNTSLNKLMEMGVKNDFLTRNGDTYSLDTSKFKSFGFKKNNQLMVLSSNLNDLQKYMKGNSGGKIDPQILEQFQGKYGALYLNLSQLFKSFKTPADTTRKFQDFQQAGNFFDNFFYTTQGYQQGAAEFNITLNLTNQKDNSLTQLIRFMDQTWSTYCQGQKGGDSIMMTQDSSTLFRGQ